MKAFLFASVLAAGTFSTANADDTPVTTQSSTPVVMTSTTSSMPVARRGLFSRLRGRMVTPMTATTVPTVVTPATTTTPSPTPMPSTKVTKVESTDKGVVQASGTTTTTMPSTTSHMPVATTMVSTTKPVRRMGFMSRIRMVRSSY